MYKTVAKFKIIDNLQPVFKKKKKRDVHFARENKQRPWQTSQDSHPIKSRLQPMSSSYCLRQKEV